MMLHRTKTLLAVFALSLLWVAISYSDSHDTIDLRQLEGDWEGRGEFLVPITGITMSVEGQARFDYDSTQGHLRTAMVGEKYLFSYSDSGHLKLDEQTDSISWEVWDNFGKHSKYHGIVSGNKISGDRYKKKKYYRVMIELVTPDSIDFKLTVTEPDGDRYDRATFNLWRVKP